MRNVTRVIWPTVQRHLAYGATVGLLTASVTWNLLLGLQVWAISSLATYLVFCAAFHAVATFEARLEAVHAEAVIELRAKAIAAGRSKPKLSGMGYTDLKIEGERN